MATLHYQSGVSWAGRSHPNKNKINRKNYKLQYLTVLVLRMTSASASGDPIERSWDLSLYELHRTPQEAITDPGVEIAVSARSLQSELTCPICLDMLTQTMTTKECLHR